jgi:hypothetical protein
MFRNTAYVWSDICYCYFVIEISDKSWDQTWDNFVLFCTQFLYLKGTRKAVGMKYFSDSNEQYPT